MQDERKITFRDLYPDLSEEEARIAQENVRRYVAIIWRIYERLKAEGKSWPGLEPRKDLTDQPGSSTIFSKVDPRK